MARLRAVGAALLLLALVGGVPLALWAWGVSPAALAGLLRPDDGSGVLALLTVLGWLAWVGFTVSVVAEVVNVVGRRPVPLRLPMVGGLQALAGVLVFTALSASVVPAQAATGSGSDPTPAAAAEAEPSAVVDPDDVQAGAATEGYLVCAGDDLWSIAEQQLGDGSRWRLIAEVNAGLAANPTVDLVAGSRLVIPGLPAEAADGDLPHGQGGAAASQPKQQATERVTVVVERGDTLSGLAAEHLGDAAQWPRIFKANPQRIADPDLIDVGWKLVIPTRTAHQPKPEQDRPARKPVRPQAEKPTAQQPDGQQPDGDPQRGEGRVEPQAGTPGPTAAPSGSASTDPGTAPEGGDPARTADVTWPLLGGLSGTAAAMILGGLAVNRLSQLRTRPLGRRISYPPVDVRRYETALGHRERPEASELLEKALRTLGAHARESGRALPRLDQLRLAADGVRFVWAERLAYPLPDGFTGDLGSWSLTADAAAALPESRHPVPFPALVTVGRASDGDWVMIDLEVRSPVTLTGTRTLRHAAVAALAVELSCSPWASELSLAVVGGDEMFVRAACPELVRFHAQAAPAVDALEALAAERGADVSPTVLLRVDPDRAEAGAAHVTLFADEPDAAALARLDAVLADRDLGVAGLVAGDPGSSGLVLAGDESDATLTLVPEQLTVRPQLIAAHTRAAIGTIFAATDPANHDEAPWWAEADNVRALVPHRAELRIEEREPEQPDHPYLRLFGPIDLLGAAGPAPSRARRQCEEYCGWLLQHPRSTATRMANDLVVAETTRRSNMSRLRSWLGVDPDGNAYLPEAYSGRIELHSAVESDWQRLQVLAAPGVNRLAPETLVSMLELVRGAPLADAAPGQWRWAEELRTDMSSLIRDAGVLLTRWAVDHQELEVARWAAARALLAAPEDELLLVERINTEVLAGNSAEVQRLVRWVIGQARALGLDLDPDTVDACQRALEGRTRPRVAR